MAEAVGKVIRIDAHLDFRPGAGGGIVHGDGAVDDVLIELLRLPQGLIQGIASGLRGGGRDLTFLCIPRGLK